MRTSRRTTFFLVVLVLLLLAANAALWVMKDHSGPTIQIPDTEITYRADSETAPLLEGVTATDSRDGDVSDTIRIRGVLPSEDGKTAMVMYMAKDQSNNVSTATKEVNYTIDGQTVVGGSSSEQTVSGEEANEQAIANLSRYAPRIYLKEYEINLAVGDEFSSMSYVRYIQDDYDSYDLLSRRVSVNGDVNTTQPGTYQVTYSVIDTAGNKSNSAVLTVHVGEAAPTGEAEAAE